VDRDEHLRARAGRGARGPLDEGLAEILGDLQRLTQANMSEEIDRFAAALRWTSSFPKTSDPHQQ